MKKIIFIFLSSFFLNLTFYDCSYSLILVKPATNKSRFGDCLGMIFAAIYISEKYKLPIIFSNFVESKNLAIQKNIDELKNFNFNNFKKIKLKSENQINLNIQEDTIYEVDIEFFFKNYDITRIEDVKKKFKKLIQPSCNIQSACLLKTDSINIAVHIRKGGGFDLPLLSNNEFVDEKNYYESPIDSQIIIENCKNKLFSYADLRWPHKFPPDSYYIEQIKYISQIFSNKKIHVHIFTDDQNPKELLNKYKDSINNENITFSCRENNNCHNINIIDDFFSMTQFDCLIRPVSTYSQFIEVLGNFKIVTSPKHSIWKAKDLLIIDEINIIFNQDL